MHWKIRSMYFFRCYPEYILLIVAKTANGFNRFISGRYLNRGIFLEDKLVCDYFFWLFLFNLGFCFHDFFFVHELDLFRFYYDISRYFFYYLYSIVKLYIYVAYINNIRWSVIVSYYFNQKITLLFLLWFCLIEFRTANLSFLLTQLGLYYFLI